MTIRGSCLCGRVQFEITRATGPVEICHCNRCRKVSGSSGMVAVGVQTDDYRLLAGGELIGRYEAPLIYEPPAYHVWFCTSCGSPVPPANPEGDFMEIPAGLFDDDPGVKPDKHIFTEFLPPWDAITDDLPRYSVQELARSRGVTMPKDFELRSHYDADE